VSTPGRLTLTRPLDRLTAQRLQQAGVATAPQATPQVVPPRHTEAGTPRRQPPAPPQHVQAEAATRRWNAEREAEWEAAHPPAVPMQHRPADPETAEWNRLREQQWHAAPAKLEATLRDLIPAVFNDCPPPLAVGIHHTLIALLDGEFAQRTIRQFLHDWTKRPAYLAALARGDVRRDLDGCPTTLPSDTDREGPTRWLAEQGRAP
jgi:hypothetical protein